MIIRIFLLIIYKNEEKTQNRVKYNIKQLSFGIFTYNNVKSLNLIYNNDKT